jgi:hypothetical protein
MKKLKDTRAPTPLAVDVCDQLINRLACLQQIEEIEDASDVTKHTKGERDFTSDRQSVALQDVLLSSQAESVKHAILQAAIIGTYLEIVADSVKHAAHSLDVNDKSHFALLKCHRDLRTYAHATWSAVNVFRRHKQAKDIQNLIDSYQSPWSPFCDAGDYTNDAGQ